MPVGSVELKNSYNELGYGGPEPPHGSGSHPYVVTLYALNIDKLTLRPDTSLKDFKKALEGKVIATAKITGTYER
jgi:Raf kinase inhibitor-like YbhB/YbcL family protein